MVPLKTQRKSWLATAGLAVVWLALCVLLLGAVSPRASALDVRYGSASVTAELDGKRVSAMAVKLYYIATPDGTWTAGFSDYKLKLETENESSVGAMADVLHALIRRDEVRPDWEAVTDESGRVRFDTLEPGVWLFVGDEHAANGVKYHVRPGIFVIHSSESLEIELKYEAERPRPGPDDDKVIKKVLKIWDDGGDADRPKNVRVVLLHDGREYETVVLSEKNDWRHTWTGLSDKYDWTVVEDEVPSGYEAEMDQRGVTTVITNVKTETPPPEDPPVNPPTNPGNPWTPPENPGDPTTPTVPVDPGDPGTPVIPTDPKIPQTGTTWYLVPALAGLGVLFVVLGYGLIRKSGGRYE